MVGIYLLNVPKLKGRDTYYNCTVGILERIQTMKSEKLSEPDDRQAKAKMMVRSIHLCMYISAINQC